MKMQRLLAYAVCAVTALFVVGFALNAALAGAPPATGGSYEKSRDDGSSSWGDYKPHDGVKDSYNSDVRVKKDTKTETENSYNVNKKKETENSYNNDIRVRKDTHETETTTRTDSHDWTNKDSHPIAVTCKNEAKSPNKAAGEATGREAEVGSSQSTAAGQTNDCYVNANHTGQASCGSIGVVVVAQCQGNVEGPAPNNADATYTGPEETKGASPARTLAPAGGGGGFLDGLLSGMKGLLG